MKLRLEFTNSLYDCRLRIKDGNGLRELYLPLANEEGDAPESVVLEVSDGDFELTLIPAPVSHKEMLDELDRSTWKDKIVNKVVEKGISLLSKALLRVGCTYRVSGANDRDVIFISNQWYGHDSAWDLIPMAYTYYEVEHYGKTLIPTAAWGINRDEVVKASRKLALLDLGPELVFTYPIGMHRIKHLTKDRKIRKILQEFYALPEEKRQAIRAKMEK